MSLQENDKKICEKVNTHTSERPRKKKKILSSTHLHVILLLFRISYFVFHRTLNDTILVFGLTVPLRTQSMSLFYVS